MSGFLEGADCVATIAAFRNMGVRIHGPASGSVVIEGVGLHGLVAPTQTLDLGNSGTAMRLMAGLLKQSRYADEVMGILAAEEESATHTIEKVGRNEPCPCGSGKKYKRCCANAQAAPPPPLLSTVVALSGIGLGWWVYGRRTAVVNTRALKEQIEEAKAQADSLLSGANKRIEQTIREIREAEAEKEKTREVRRDFEEFKEALEVEKGKEEKKVEKRLEEIRKKGSELEARRPDLKKRSKVKLARHYEKEEDPEILTGAPYTTPVRRLDEVAATRDPVLRQPSDRPAP